MDSFLRDISALVKVVVTPKLEVGVMPELDLSVIPALDLPVEEAVMPKLKEDLI